MSLRPERPDIWADGAFLRYDVLPDEDECPMTLEVAAIYIRAAYGNGYVDAQSETEPLTVEQARVALARLKLDLPGP